jgi:hypothetical protein
VVAAVMMVVLVMVMMVVVMMVMPLVVRRIIGSTASQRHTGGADRHRAGGAGDCDCSNHALSHRCLLVVVSPRYGGERRHVQPGVSLVTVRCKTGIGPSMETLTYAHRRRDPIEAHPG